MKTIYKILIIFGIILIIGNSMYLFTWTQDMLKGYWIGNFVGIIIGIMVCWLVKK